MKKVVRNLAITSLLVGTGVLVYSLVKKNKKVVNNDIPSDVIDNIEEFESHDWKDVKKKYIVLTRNNNYNENSQDSKAM